MSEIRALGKLREFLADINEREINEHIIGKLENGVETWGVNDDWVRGWNRAVAKTVRDAETEIDGKLADLEGFAKRVENAVDNGEELTLFGRDYIPIPLDADGVPIHVGDIVYAGDWYEARTVDSYAIVCRTSDGHRVWHDGYELRKAIFDSDENKEER